MGETRAPVNSVCKGPRAENILMSFIKQRKTPVAGLKEEADGRVEVRKLGRSEAAWGIRGLVGTLPKIPLN